MKKNVLLVVLIGFAVISCHKKAVPTVTTRSIDITQTVQSDNTTPDLESGKSTFEARCNRCHNLPDPAKYNAPRWELILSIMTFRAKLTKEEIDNVAAYIKANCAK